MSTSTTALRSACLVAVSTHVPDDVIVPRPLSRGRAVGEPINPEAWAWYHDVAGEGRCRIADTWWQTETGGIMLCPSPLVSKHKPGYAMHASMGVVPLLVDAEGRVLEGNGVEGVLTIQHPTPGMARTIFGDHQRYFETYWKPYPGLYFTGDGALRDEDGHYRITGRVDDVINVSGHRMGTAEVRLTYT